MGALRRGANAVRLPRVQADKTIKIWKEDDTADEETHPIDMKSWTQQCRARKRY